MQKKIERVIEVLSTIAALATAIAGVLGVVITMLPSYEKSKEDGE